MKLLLLYLVLLPLAAAGSYEEPEEGSHLPKEVKEQLEKQFGTDLKTRVEKLKKIGYEYVIPEEIRRRSGEGKHEEIKDEEELSIWEINERAGIARYFWDGDIDLTEKQFEKIEKLMKEGKKSTNRRHKRQAEETVFNRWLDRKVYYFFDDFYYGHSGRKIVKEVIDFYEKHTCIRFEENSTVPDRIRIQDGRGCQAWIGFNGGEQTMTLANGCRNFGNVAHEFLHSLGFYHTHMRPDRDGYVSLNRKNIKYDVWNINFPKIEIEKVNMYTPYEYASVMHYPANAFSINRKPAIIAKDHRYAYTMGSRRKLTFYDLKALNEHYLCNVRCPPKLSAKCSNGGYPNPNKCSVCICPDGYGGQFCNERPPGCGFSLNATEEWQEAKVFVNHTSTRYVVGNVLQCTDWITAPEGKYVEVKIGSLYGSYCEYSCNNAALEIKMETPEETSPRFCCSPYIESTHVSKLNPTPVIAYTRNSDLEFKYYYRFVDNLPKTTEADPLAPVCTDKFTSCPGETLTCWDRFNEKVRERDTDCPVTCDVCSK